VKPLRLLFLFLLVDVARADGQAASSGESSPSKPNIVFILSDDLGYGDVDCYNKDSKIPTPHIDEMAADGIRFTDAHAATALCTPSRYAILTGRYCWRTPMHAGVLGIFAKPLIAADRLTVPAMLKQSGYTTAAFGKWHLGFTWPGDRPADIDYSKPILNGPTTRGFDYFFGVDCPNYPPYCFIENDHTVGIPSMPAPNHHDGFDRPGLMVPGWKLVNVLPDLTAHAVKWIGDTAKTGQPFFMYFALTSPHAPVLPAPQFKGASQAGDYGDYVVETDWAVGQVRDALKKAGVADHTLVIFTSDNGPEIIEQKIGAYDRILKYHHYSMGPLRGVKRDVWEGGHRLPFLADWPGKIKPGLVSNETICHVDLMATAAAIVGYHLPDSAGPDSYNELPALLQAKLDHPVRETTIHASGDGHLAIRKGDWVFIDAPTGLGSAKYPEPAWFKKERRYVDDHLPGELYNLADDLPERHNYYAEKPEIVRQLKTLLDQYKSEGRSTPGPPQPNDVALEGTKQIYPRTE
jgi:arylsulfatase A-like enzyme